jgi:hypothetical protein
MNVFEEILDLPKKITYLVVDNGTEKLVNGVTEEYFTISLKLLEDREPITLSNLNAMLKSNGVKESDVELYFETEKITGYEIKQSFNYNRIIKLLW